MIKRGKSPKIFFGWWITLVTGILSGLGFGFFINGISVLFKPIASELVLNRASTSVAAGLGTLQNGLMFAFTGWLSDKYGPKWLIITGICIMGTGLVLMNFISSAWNYYIVWGIIVGAGHTLGFAVANDKMLADWFISKRGLALGTRFALMSIMSALILPFISWLLMVQGWRMTCLIWAGVIFAGVPLALYFVRQRRPEYYGLLPDGAKVDSSSELSRDDMIAKGVSYATGLQETEFTLREALKTLFFWKLTMGRIILQSVMQGFNVHCIPFLTDMDIDPIVAGSMMAMMVFFTIPSRFFGGFIADRVRKVHLKLLLAGALLFMAAGITSFLLSQSIATVYTLLILFGLGNGAYVTIDLTSRGRYFGRKAYGSILGASIMIASPISFLAPIYTGWIYDTTGNYTTAFTLFTILATFAACIMCIGQPPKLSVHMSKNSGSM